VKRETSAVQAERSARIGLEVREPDKFHSKELSSESTSDSFFTDRMVDTWLTSEAFIMSGPAFPLLLLIFIFGPILISYVRHAKKNMILVDSKRGWRICHMFFGISMNHQSNLLSHLGSALFKSRFGNY
jgi:hypothetical protein